jgi:hypothetical protein
MTQPFVNQLYCLSRDIRCYPSNQRDLKKQVQTKSEERRVATHSAGEYQKPLVYIETGSAENGFSACGSGDGYDRVLMGEERQSYDRRRR